MFYFKNSNIFLTLQTRTQQDLTVFPLVVTDKSVLQLSDWQHVDVTPLASVPAVHVSMHSKAISDLPLI